MNIPYVYPLAAEGGEATLIEKTITQNGTYPASADGADGFSSVTVEVPDPVLKTKQITANGTYAASGDNADGYSSVEVNVPPTLFRDLVDGTITAVTKNDLLGVSNITAYSFYQKQYLRSVEIPNTVDTVEMYNFYNCNITSLAFEENSTLKTIGAQCFRYMNTTERLRLPDSVQTIDENALRNLNNIKEIIFGTSLQSIASFVGRNNLLMTKVVIKATAPPTLSSSNVFDVPDTSLIYVPTPNDYKVATNWTALASRIFPLVSTVADLTNIDTTTYTKACVIGADESYKEYTYDGAQWNEVT